MHSISDRLCNTQILQLPDALLIEEVQLFHQRFPNEFGVKDFTSVLIDVARFEVPVLILDLDLPPIDSSDLRLPNGNNRGEHREIPLKL